MLPLLYLHGLSSQRLRSGVGAVPRLRRGPVGGDDHPADRAVAGRGRGVQHRDRWPDTDYVYVWVDGIHLKVRLEQDKVCLLVMIGVRADGRKELVALADGFRESTESWADLLRSCRRRGMTAPVLAVGDGALGFWKAVREVFPDTREQRCWFHKSGQCPCRPAEVGAPGREGRARGDLQRRGQRPRPSRGQGVRGRLRRQVAQGGREDHRRPRRAAGVLRLPRRALDPPADHEPDRVDLRHRPAAAPGSPRAPAPGPPESRWRSS